MNKYAYDGPVMIFNKCVQSKWHGETMAVSEKKAKSNLKYRAKKLAGNVAYSNIELPGKLRIIE